MCCSVPDASKAIWCNVCEGDKVDCSLGGK